MSKRWLATVLSCAMLLGCLGGLSLFVGADESDGHYAYDFTKRYADETYTGEGLAWVDFDDGHGTFTADGFKAAAGSPTHCYFQAEALRSDAPMNLGLKVITTKNDDWMNWQYNSATGGDYKGIERQKSSWMLYYVVDDAQFGGKQNAGADFRMQIWDQRTVKRVDLYVLNAETLTSLTSEAAIKAVLADKVIGAAYTAYADKAAEIRKALTGTLTQAKINGYFSELWSAEADLRSVKTKMPSMPGYYGGKITVDETTGAITLGDGGFFYYNWASEMWTRLGVAANETVDLEITLDYLWATNGSTNTGAPWCQFKTIQADGTGTKGDGFGNLSADYHFVPDQRSTITVSRKDQLLMWDNTLEGEDHKDNKDSWYMVLGNAGEQTLTIYGVSFKATKADGSYTIATLGTTPDAQGTDVKGYTVALKEDIGLNAALSLSDGVATDPDAKILITDSGASVKTEINVKDLAKDDAGNCSVMAELPAKTMKDTIYIHVISGNDQWTTTYSVADYAQYILDHQAEDAYAEAASLVKAMLNYGAAAQTYFGYNTGSLANASLADEDKNLSGVDKTTLSHYNSYNKKQSENGITLKAANLSLLSKTTLRLFFDIGDKDVSALTFRRGEQVLAVGQDGDQYYVEIDLAPNELATEVAVTVEQDGAVLMTAQYAVMAYGYNVLRADANTYGALQNVIRALYLYNAQAAAYAG